MSANVWPDERIASYEALPDADRRAVDGHGLRGYALLSEAAFLYICRWHYGYEVAIVRPPTVAPKEDT